MASESWRHRYGIEQILTSCGASEGGFRKALIESFDATDDFFRDVDEEEIPNLPIPDAWKIDATKQHVDLYEVVVTSDIDDEKCQKYGLLAIALDDFSWTIAIHVCHWMGNIIASDNPIKWGYYGPKDGGAKLDPEVLEDQRRFPDMESIEAWGRKMRTKESKNSNVLSTNKNWPSVEEMDRWQELFPEEPQPNWWRKFQKGW